MKKLSLKKAASNLVESIAKKYNVRSLANFKCPHVRALAEVVGWKAPGPGKYEDLKKEFMASGEDSEDWNPKYFFFAIKENPDDGDGYGKSLEIYLSLKWEYDENVPFQTGMTCGYFRLSLPSGISKHYPEFIDGILYIGGYHGKEYTGPTLEEARQIMLDGGYEENDWLIPAYHTALTGLPE